MSNAPHKPVANERRKRRVAIVVVCAMLAAVAIPAIALVMSLL